MMMTACSNEDIVAGGDPTTPGTTPENTVGDLYMTMNIAHKAETRTETPNQGYEVGKDYENAISGALVIFATGNESSGYTVLATSGQISTNGTEVGHETTPEIGADSDHQTTPTPGDVEVDPSHANGYKATFTFNRQTLLNALDEDVQSESGHDGATKKKTFSIFVIANPSKEIIDAAQVTQNVQQIFTKATNDKKYWEKKEFLMSNANISEITIYDNEIALGTHISKNDPFHLGTVYVQRAMSRFDLDTQNNHKFFEGEGDNSETGPSALKNIRVEFDAVAMINMAKKAYLFKVMNTANISDAATRLPIKFGNERDSRYEDYWVLSPGQDNAYFNPLFTSLSSTTGDDKSDFKYTGTAAALKSFFATGADYQLISTLTEEDQTFEHPSHESSTQGSYHIWRYCMENTNPDKIGNQKNANSTGVVFRAKLTNPESALTKVIPEEYTQDDTEKDGEALYAFGNVILGTAEQLKQFATNPKAENDESGVYESVRNIYADAIQNALDKNKKPASSGEWTIEDGYVSEVEGTAWFETKADDYETSGKLELHYGSLSDLDKYLVENSFSIYRPENVNDKPVYYCYYIYWNRHNDNRDNTQMGTMEFATVRNNVYKLAVNKIWRLGHPGEPDDDPDTPDPDDPDEKDEFWLDVNCEILPWEVRVNDIEF